MRRTTVHRTTVRPAVRRRLDETDEPGQELPEVRKDIRRTWWPDAQGGPADGIRGR
jgi:hypothetical protein